MQLLFKIDHCGGRVRVINANESLTVESKTMTQKESQRSIIELVSRHLALLQVLVGSSHLDVEAVSGGVLLSRIRSSESNFVGPIERLAGHRLSAALLLGQLGRASGPKLSLYGLLSQGSRGMPRVPGSNTLRGGGSRNILLHFPLLRWSS